MEAGHLHALLGQPVQSWRGNLAAIWAGVAKAKVVGDDNEKVWSFGGSHVVSELVECREMLRCHMEHFTEAQDDGKTRPYNTKTLDTII